MIDENYLTAIKKINRAKKNNSHHLRLGFLNLSKLPDEIFNLTNLETLTLERNQISIIPDKISKLSNLQNLNLRFNQLKSIPTNFSKLTNLVKLDLSHNQLNSIPENISKLKKLTSINLTNNFISSLPYSISELTNLSILHLQDNLFNKFPEQILALINLEVLGISGNKVFKIPQKIEKLTSLSKFYIHSNNLKTLPEGFSKLESLEELYLQNNQIKVFPPCIEKLNNLKELYLQNNQIEIIPEGISKLEKLTKLYLQNNQIQILSMSISGMGSLTKIDLSNNLIDHLPESILSLNLPILWEKGYFGTGINVIDNPFSIPSPSIIQGGNEAIREYFIQSEESGEGLLLEAKLILLGDGRSGKTSLANRLVGKELPKEADRTQGVDIVIGEYNFLLSEGKEFKLNIWDFAGQDKYKTLHQLFYTESSLYVLVVESGNLKTDFNDWLQTAELFGEGSPLLVLLNEFKPGIGMGSFDSSYWKKQFPDLLKEVFVVNLLTKENLHVVESYIRLLAQTLPHTSNVFPSNWAAIRRELIKRRDEQYISLKEYFNICKSNNLPERESALVLSSILHKIGDFLHYQKSDLLKQIIILKNEWATEAVYKILDDKIVAEDKCGFFDQTDLKRIWNSEEYIDMRPQLLELMQQFKLTYQLPGKEEYVTPPLLPHTRPEDFNWPDLDYLELFIEYEFLPKALLTQFIVSRHLDIANERTLVWRNGVILNWENEALAEVSKTKLRGRDAIYIRSQGINRKGMMTVILKTFRDLHNEYKGIKNKELVPCNCSGCNNHKNNQHFYDFAHLKRRQENGKIDVECIESLESINLINLLDNSFIFEQIKLGEPLYLKENIKRGGHFSNRVLKIFLACSNELKAERERIEQVIGRKNQSMRRLNFFIELLIWENGKHIGKSLRSQNNYNFEVDECDLFIMLFYSKVGKYTREEFEKAKLRFNENGTPRILIFQKDKDLPKEIKQDDANSRFDFLSTLKEIEHFPAKYHNVDALINEIEHAFDKLFVDELFLDNLTITSKSNL